MYGVSHLLGTMWKYVTVRYVWYPDYLWWHTPISESPSATEVTATCHLSLPCRLQWHSTECGAGFLSSSNVSSSSDIHTKRSLEILMAIPVIIFFPSVTREVLIQSFASDMQIYVTGKKGVCVEALVYINFSKCTLTEPKYPVRVIFSQFMQSLYKLFLFNGRQMLVFATSFSLCVRRSDV